MAVKEFDVTNKSQSLLAEQRTLANHNAIVLTNYSAVGQDEAKLSWRKELCINTANKLTQYVFRTLCGKCNLAADNTSKTVEIWCFQGFRVRGLKYDLKMKPNVVPVRLCCFSLAWFSLFLRHDHT